MNDAILRRIKKCLALSQSSNQHEAEIALKHAQKLMQEHGVRDKEVLASDVQESLVKSGAIKSVPQWENDLANLVSSAFGCKLIHSRRGSVAYWKFIGVELSSNVASYAFDVLFRQVKKARKEYINALHKNCKSKTKTTRADNFCTGWVSGVRKKIYSFSSTESNEAIAAYMQINYPILCTLPTIDRSTDRDRNGFWDGYNSAQDVRLNHGVSGINDVKFIS